MNEPQEPGYYQRDQAFVHKGTSAQHILHCEVKGQPNPPPLPKITAAFGARECPKVVELLDHSELEVRRQALYVLCDLFKTPKAIASCLQAGVIKRLAQMVLDVDLETRTKASQAMLVLCADANGMQAMLTSGACDTMYPALNDTDTNVRFNVYETLIIFSASLSGVEAICRADYVPVLVEKAAQEEDTIKPLALQLLYNALRQPSGDSLREAQKCNAINVCTDLLTSKSAAVREKASLAMTSLTLSDAGKQFAIKANAVEGLCPLLEDPNWKVRANAAGSIMSIAIDDMGKVATIESGGIDRLVQLLRDPERLVKLNTLKAIAAVCPHPKAREEFQASEDCMAALNFLVQDDNDELICRSAKITKEVVEWQP